MAIRRFDPIFLPQQALVCFWNVDHLFHLNIFNIKVMNKNLTFTK